MGIKIGDKVKWYGYEDVYLIKDIRNNNDIEEILFEWVDKNSGSIKSIWHSSVHTLNSLIEKGTVALIENIRPIKDLEKLKF